jgi:hypothetical protein
VPKARPGMTLQQWGEAVAESHGQVPKGSVHRVVEGLYVDDVLV